MLRVFESRTGHQEAKPAIPMDCGFFLHFQRFQGFILRIAESKFEYKKSKSNEVNAKLNAKLANRAISRFAYIICCLPRGPPFSVQFLRNGCIFLPKSTKSNNNAVKSSADKERATMIRILLSTRLGEKRWTQTRLAQETGIRAASINELYNEMVDSISLEKLDKICRALDCDVGDILAVETDELRRTLADKPRK